MWNKDKEPKELDVYWKELTPEQQASAEVLGWSKCCHRAAILLFSADFRPFQNCRSDASRTKKHNTFFVDICRHVLVLIDKSEFVIDFLICVPTTHAAVLAGDYYLSHLSIKLTIVLTFHKTRRGGTHRNCQLLYTVAAAVGSGLW